MADTKITALTALTAADPANDVLPIVDVSDTTMAASGTTKKISVNNILGASGTATLASATISGDLTVDTSTLKVDSTNNRVGIGTATPAVTLDISDPSSVIRATSSTGTNTSFAAFANTGGAVRVGAENSAGGGLFTGSSAYSAVFGTTGAYSAHIGTNSSVRYSIASDGVATWQNVGGVAGTAMTLNSTGLGVGTSPTTKLDVLGSGDGELRLRAGSDAALIFSETAANKNWKLKPSGGDFQFQYSATAYNSGYSPLMYLTATGNLGIGVTPSAWGAGYKALQLQSVARNIAATGAGSGDLTVAFNAIYDSTDSRWEYAGTGDKAGRYSQTGSGNHRWFVSNTAGTAGNEITDFASPAMTLDASGNLLVGTTSTSGSASNATKTVGGSFSTVNGATGSIATGVAATLFTAPSESVFMVSAYIVGSSSPANYNAVAIVKVSGGTAAITTVSSALNLTISLSGLNVQATQTSGVNQAFAYSAIRIS